MTREEAIQVLKDTYAHWLRLKEEHLLPCSECEEVTEAIDMAISALQAEPSRCEDCEYWNDTEDGCADRHGCNTEPSDLISRADAIEAVKQTKPIVRSTERNWGKMIAEQHSKELVQALKTVPSVSAERVVRCKDCEHRYWDKTSEFWTCYHTMDLAIEDNDFCSLAKMKGGAE